MHIGLHVTYQLIVHIGLHVTYQLIEHIGLYVTYQLIVHTGLHVTYQLIVHIVLHDTYQLIVHIGLHVTYQLIVHIGLHVTYQLIVHIGLHVGKKVKCTLVQALRLCTGRTAHRGSRGMALLFLDHGTRRGEGQRHAPAALYPGKDAIPIVQEAGWAPSAGLDGCGKSRPPRDSIPGPSRP